MPKKDNSLKISLDDETNVMLADLATLLAESKAKIIRDAIAWRHKMQRQGVPTCSNGRPCYVAHLHFIQSTTATPVENPTEAQRQRLVAPAAVVGF